MLCVTKTIAGLCETVWIEGVCPVSRLFLTDVGWKGDFVDRRVQVDDVRRSFVGMKMSRQPLRETPWRWEPDRKQLGIETSFYIVNLWTVVLAWNL